MRITLPDKEIKVFTISPRTIDPDEYWRNVCDTIRWSEKYDCTGVLVFTGNDTYVDPWLVAQVTLDKTSRLLPLVAVNPVYMHPFSVAKLISSLSYLYHRPVFLNMVTGTALSHLQALGDSLDHDERYDRMQEYMVVVKSLVTSVRPVSFQGRFYKIDNLQLLPGVPSGLAPGFVLAGQSAAARKVCELTGATGIQMLPSNPVECGSGNRGIHFGIVTRKQDEEAWNVARRLFPVDKLGQEVLGLSMRNTDSVWKLRMKFEAGRPDLLGSGYWLEPFRNFRADCPYVVGSYERVAHLVDGLIRQGIELFILDVPAIEEEYGHTAHAFELAREYLGLPTVGRSRAGVPLPSSA